ncbi:immunity protein Imm33 domain-containing protein [Mangrovimonas xylaniphaga]|uniref:immunity protein Imm33 domain-containing protein n=1 Tax=Mangrovimonas xylaniphaga TaxID=1645915 RepID=UPI0006B59D95|nr:DUF2185 domain-containing protein [Mangrovimonas xylaniphaga]
MFKDFFKKKHKFLFNESENVACIVCDHVLNRTRDILFVTHDLDDGQWSFLCGGEDHEMRNYKLISLKQVIEIDESVNDLYEMPLGFGADRKKIGAKWEPFKQPEVE